GDEGNVPAEKIGKHFIGLGDQRGFPSALEFGDQLAINEADFDDSWMRSLAPQVFLAVGAGVFGQDFGGDLGLVLFVVGGFANPMLAAAVRLVADGFHDFGIGDEVSGELYDPRLGINLGVVHGDFDVHVAEVAAVIALGQAEAFGVGMAVAIQ